MNAIWRWRGGEPANEPNKRPEQDRLQHPMINGEPDFLYGIEAVQAMSPFYEYQISGDFNQERRVQSRGKLGATFDRKLNFPVQYPRRSDGSATAPVLGYPAGSEPWKRSDF